MLGVISSTYIIRIIFDAKKSLNSSRKEKLKTLFEGYSFKNLDGIISFKNKNNKIALDSKNVIISSKDNKDIQEIVNKIFDIYEIDKMKKQYYLEISIKFLINNDVEELTPLEESEVIQKFFNLKKQENKIISSIEYITFMESKKEELLTISLKMYKEGIVAKGTIIVENIDEINMYFENLFIKINDSVINLLLEKKGD